MENQEQAENIFNEVFEFIVSWMSKRKLKLNADKTECILFGNQHRLDMLSDFDAIDMTDNSSLPFVRKVKNLGVFLDQYLNMECQLQSTKQKAIGNLINISKVSKFMDKESRLKLVHGLVLSHIDFCNSLYAGLPNNKLHPLQMIINCCARLVMGIPRFSHDRITPVCIELHFLPLKARIKYKICLLAFKALKYGQPAYLRELLQYNAPTRSLRNDRTDRLVEPIVAQSSYSDRCFYACAPKMFNSLPNHVRLSDTFEIFKTRLKTFLFRESYDLENLCITPAFDV